MLSRNRNNRPILRAATPHCEMEYQNTTSEPSAGESTLLAQRLQPFNRRQIGQRGRSPKPFILQAATTQANKVLQLQKHISSLVDAELQKCDPDLVKAWKSVHHGYIPEDSSSQILANLRTFKDSIPANSPVQSSIVSTFFEDVPVEETAKILGVTKRAVYNSFQNRPPPLSYYLRELGFPRDRLNEAKIYLSTWLSENCPVRSGQRTRSYTGTKEMLWTEYALWCQRHRYPCVHSSTLNSLLKVLHIGLRPGDLFMNPDNFELADLRQKVDRLRTLDRELDEDELLENLQKRINTLEKDAEFAQQRKKKYREAHTDLQYESDSMVITMDFSAEQTSMSSKFHELVFVLATATPLELPPSLREAEIPTTRPISLKGEAYTPGMQKCFISNLLGSQQALRTPSFVRRTKKEIASSDKPGRIASAPTHKKVVEKQKRDMKKRVLPELIQSPSLAWKPHLTYLFFIAKREKTGEGEEAVKQTFPYVQWALDTLYESGLFYPYKKLSFWSDGCGKHFKTYPAHYHFGVLQGKKNGGTILKIGNLPDCCISWDFLAPREAHNRCDAAAAHFHSAVKLFIRNLFQLEEVEHLAYAARHLTNAHVIRADFPEFPETRTVINDKSFMHDAFQFAYEAPCLLAVTCNHACKNKQTCLHACCKGAECWTVKVNVMLKDGTHTSYKLRLDDTEAEPESLSALEPAWSSQTWKAYTTPSHSQRVSVAVLDNMAISWDENSSEVESEYAPSTEERTIPKSKRLSESTQRPERGRVRGTGRVQSMGRVRGRGGRGR